MTTLDFRFGIGEAHFAHDPPVLGQPLIIVLAGVLGFGTHSRINRSSNALCSGVILSPILSYLPSALIARPPQMEGHGQHDCSFR